MLWVFPHFRAHTLPLMSDLSIVPVCLHTSAMWKAQTQHMSLRMQEEQQQMYLIFVAAIQQVFQFLISGLPLRPTPYKEITWNKIGTLQWPCCWSLTHTPLSMYARIWSAKCGGVMVHYLAASAVIHTCSTEKLGNSEAIKPEFTLQSPCRMNPHMPDQTMWDVLVTVELGQILLSVLWLSPVIVIPVMFQTQPYMSLTLYYPSKQQCY
jgi:hypothetical protein